MMELGEGEAVVVRLREECEIMLSTQGIHLILVMWRGM